MTHLIVLLVVFTWVLPSAIAFILLLFQKTHFIVEYANLVGLGRFVFADEFLEWEKTNQDVGYPIFLYEKHNNFLTRMLRCPWCLATWLSILANCIVIYYLVPIMGKSGALLFGWLWSFSIGYVATMLYFCGLRIYERAFPTPEPEEEVAETSAD